MQSFQRICFQLAFSALGVLTTGSVSAYSSEVSRMPPLEVPDGLRIRRVADVDVIKRPICADFDDLGRLLVAESSGTNDPVQQQLQSRPHSIVCLADTDDDGTFDQRTVFADRMMFPEGVMCLGDSVYVAAPPEIWKLTDDDRDGVADRREVWFDGKTLTGCANDLHGPFLGPDGWIYWCKGAFAEQTYTIDGESWSTRAAHIFRRRVEGGAVEPVMTGGMDNPVEVGFTRTGALLFTSTFIQHPAGGRRDGLLHAVHGGVYGKTHSVIHQHPRTGDVLPPVAHLGPAAPSGMTVIRSNRFGQSFLDDVLVCQFNLNCVSRFKLSQHGGTFQAKQLSLLSSPSVDFHPTDVLEAPDGSIVVLDTGGWYKLCCPSSQLHKPDVLGGIYRITPVEKASSDVDPASDQPVSPTDKLDSPPTVTIDPAANLTALNERWRNMDSRGRVELLWFVVRTRHKHAPAVVVEALNDSDADVRQTALQVCLREGITDALPRVRMMLSPEYEDSAFIQRLAIAYVGKYGDSSDALRLWQCELASDDPFLIHQLTYAFYELQCVDFLRSRLLITDGVDARRRQIAFLALAELWRHHPRMRTAELENVLLPQLVRLCFEGSTAQASSALWWLGLSPEWIPDLLEELPHHEQSLADRPALLELVANELPQFAHRTDIQAKAADVFPQVDRDSSRYLLLRLLASDKEQHGVDQRLLERMADYDGTDERLLRTYLYFVLQRYDGRSLPPSFVQWAGKIRRQDGLGTTATIMAHCVDGNLTDELLLDALRCVHRQPEDAAYYVDVLKRIQWNDRQRNMLANQVSEMGPMQLRAVLPVYAHVVRNASKESADELLQVVSGNRAAATIPAAQWKEAIGDAASRLSFPATTGDDIGGESIGEKLAALLAKLPEGDPRQGHQLFFSDKAACSACHMVGYIGGNVGPDLSRVGKIRATDELLEAIVYPSQSFVQSYEPLNVLTRSGQQYTGVQRSHRPGMLSLIQADLREIQIPQKDIDQVLPARQSVMPSGFEQQLTLQELADLIAFLKRRE